MTKLAIVLLALLLLISPASAKVYILKWGKTYEVWETKGLYDYPVQGGIGSEKEARKVAKERRGK